MSLQVWLPLNGNLNNQGLSDVTVTNNGATVDNNGKIGKCYKFDGTYLTVSTGLPANPTIFSFCSWVKLISGYAVNNGCHLVALGNNCRICVSKDSAAIRFIGNNATVSCSSSVSSSELTTDVWYHVAVTFDNGNVRMYLNGAKVADSNVGATSLNLSNNMSTQVGSYTTELSKAYMNDFRIYDHCLSPKEVKEISKGLCLHYQLKGFGQPNLINKAELYTNSTKLTRTASKSDDYIHTSMTVNLTANTTYTISFYTTGVMPNQIELGLMFQNGYNYYKFMNGSYHHKIRDDLYYHNEPFTVANTGSYTIRCDWNISGETHSFWNFKIEEGSKATPWCPNSADSLYSSLGFNSNIEPDCSGFGNNGIKTGSITVNSDSARYSTSYQFIESSSGYIKNTNFNTICNNLTIAYWIKVNPTISSQHFLMGTFNNWTANGIGIWRDTGSVDYSYLIRVGEASNYSSWVKPSLTANVWTHIALVYNGTALITYKNGIEIGRNTYGANGTVSNPVMYLGNSMFNGTPNSETDSAKVSDFRFYATALSADDIKELYNSPASIDKSGNLFAYEYQEV